jgi:hypothetical protein
MQQVDVHLAIKTSGGQSEPIANAAKRIEQNIAMLLSIERDAESVGDMRVHGMAGVAISFAQGMGNKPGGETWKLTKQCWEPIRLSA